MDSMKLKVQLTMTVCISDELSHLKRSLQRKIHVLI